MSDPNLDSVLVLLPAYNEAERIAGVIAAVRQAAPEANIVVVDDGSTDGTGARARGAGATVLPLPMNMGYGVALQTGYKFASREGFSHLVQLDSDGQHDPAGILTLLERVRGGACDVCLGSRFLEGGTYKIPITRRVGMYIFRRVASLLLGRTITDPTTGFQAMNRAAFTFLCGDFYPVDYPDANLLVLLHRHGFRVAEAPVVMRASDSGRSIHAGVKPLYYLFKMSLDIPLNLIRRER